MMQKGLILLVVLTALAVADGAQAQRWAAINR